MQQRQRTDDIERLLHRLDHREEQEQDTESGVEEIIDVYFVRRETDTDDVTHVVDSTPPQQRPRRTLSIESFLALLVSVFFGLCVVFGVVLPELPSTVTVTIIPKSEQVSFTSTLQMGRVLSPITLSQTTTVPTTGKGHQDAQQAAGMLTFYNGLSTVERVRAGEVLTGNDGVHVAPDVAVTIPPANPPSLGAISVTAHAVNAGASGNIQAEDIHTTLSTGVYVKNLAPFTGGQDSRDYAFVTRMDIEQTATSMKAPLAQGLQGAFQGQATPQEQLHLLPCTPTVTTDHRVGQEATTVKIVVSATCSAVAYNNETLLQRTAALFSTQALKQLGAGYSLLSTAHVTVTQATATNKHPVILSFTCTGTWVYALSQTAQQQIKMLVAGKTQQQALQLLLSQKGITSVTITGIPDTKKLPDDVSRIHLLLIVEG